jgi:hypothetical protein
LLASRRKTWNQSNFEDGVNGKNLKIKLLKMTEQADQKLRESNDSEIGKILIDISHSIKTFLAKR